MPEFSRPPLIEVVCGLQFAALELRTVHIGDFWQMVRDRYPSFEDHAPLADIFDDEDRGLRVEQDHFLDKPPLRRVFFIDKTKNFLLQLGPSRFLSNWRKLRDTDEYPRFDATNAKLSDGWKQFNQYVAANDLGRLRLNQYELTYINHIPEQGTGHFLDEADELFTFFRRPTLPDELFGPHLGGANLRFQVRFKKTPGSLAVSLKHGERVPDGRKTFILELTARGAAAEDGSDRDRWFSFAHEAIVETFASLTTDKAHQRWGRTQ